MKTASAPVSHARRCARSSLAALLVCGALLITGALAGGTAPQLVVTTADGEELVVAPLPDEMTWQLEWRHSVAQVTVLDLFAFRGGTMLVVGQVTPYLDIAGLGGFAGRGTMEQLPDGTYRLSDIDLPIFGNVHNFIIGTERAPSVLIVGTERFELSRMRPGDHARIEVQWR